MVARLKSTLGKIPWSLVLRPVLLSGAWLFTPWWSALFLGVFFFFRSGSKPPKLFWSFAVLMGLSLLPKWRDFPAPYQAQFLGFFAVCSVLSWFLILAIKELFFVERAKVQSVLQAILFFLCAIYFFWQFDLVVTSFPGVVFLLACLFLFYDFFSLVSENSQIENWLLALISLLIIAEFSWAVSLLSLGFLNGTALLILIFCTYEYMWLDYFSGCLYPRRVFFNVGLLLVGFFVIALFSNWKI